MKKTVGQTLQAIRAHPDGIADFLDDVPDAIPYAKGMMRAITENRIPLHGTPYQVAQRAFDYERGDKIAFSIDHFFDEEDKRNAKKS